MRIAVTLAMVAAAPATAGQRQRADPELLRSVDRIFAQVDADRDGRVTRVEGAAFIADRRLSRANRERIWNRLDANRDGFVSKAELTVQAIRYEKQMRIR